MKVSDLKKELEKLPDDAEVFAIVGDHQARKITLRAGHVAVSNRRDYYEYFGDEHLTEGERKIQALVEQG